jgi:hypothetical protein
VKTEAEVGVILPYAKGCQEPPRIGKDKKGFFLCLKHGPLNTWVLYLWPPER